MNARIQELIAQAEEVVFSAPSSSRTTKQINLEKFAELIVQDCRDMFIVGSVSWNLLNEKLEHFGVVE